MKSIVFQFFCLIFTCTVLSAQPGILSPRAEISLLTVTPGAELYSTFGHSSLRIYDPAIRLDRVYNWGTFDFDAPNFYTNFLRGKLVYFLNPEPYPAFEYGNFMEKRSVTESILNLNSEEKQRIYDLVNTNLLPENRSYKYDFFYDDCSTRIKDALAVTFDHQMTWDSSLYKKEEKTMRQLLRPYMENKPWTWFGMQLILGIPTDKKANLEDFMFLPDHLHSIFKKTKKPDGTALVSFETIKPDPPFPVETFNADFITSPFLILSLVAVLGLFSMANPKIARIFDRIFWFVLGILGLLFALLWFATDHTPTFQNMNLLWALPTHLLVFWRSRKTSWVDLYFVGTGILAALFLVFYNWLPQDVPLGVLPIAFLVVVKGIWGRRKESTIVA